MEDNIKTRPVDPILVAIGQDIRRIRQECGVSQQQVADIFGWQRDAISKLERGLFNVSLANYLQLMDWLREGAPANHPGLALADRFRRAAKSLT